MPTVTDDDLVTQTEAAQLLGISQQYTSYLVRNGKIATVPVPEGWWEGRGHNMLKTAIPRSALRRFAQERIRELEQEIARLRRI